MDELRYQLDLLKAMNQKLDGREKMYRFLCDTSSSALIYYSFEKDEAVTLGSFSHFFDFEVKTRSDFPRFFDVVDKEYEMNLRDIVYPEKTGRTHGVTECRVRDKKAWLEFEVNVCYDEAAHPMDMVLRIRDVSRVRIQNEELKFLAYYDSLTGLYNRNYFVQLLGEFLGKAQENDSVVSVMIIDIDNFRKINDGMGIIVGDELVQQVGQMLREFSSPDILVGHINSDIFCMAVYEPFGLKSIENIYKEIQHKLMPGFLLSGGQEIQITVSVGVAEYPETAKGALELLNCAEIVMFKAKSNGKDNLQYYDAPILQEFLKNVEIENKLKEALYKKSFELYFQPQYEAGSRRLRGAEVLLRLKDGNTMIPPSVFIPIAEKNGYIVPIGDWVIEQSLKTFADWKRKYGYSMILSINISAIQYKKADFVDLLMERIHSYAIEPNEIELEITESVLIDDFELMKEKLLLLREYGLRISLDDFGTGFSSLSYLKGLPIDTLKIDKSFIDTSVTDDSSGIITEAVIAMAHKLGYETVAEGVEYQNQYEFLQSAGCDIIQGYFFGRPVPEEELERILVQLL